MPNQPFSDEEYFNCFSLWHLKFVVVVVVVFVVNDEAVEDDEADRDACHLLYG